MPTTAEELALLDLDTALPRAAEHLADRCIGTFTAETIARPVNASYVAQYRAAGVTA